MEHNHGYTLLNDQFGEIGLKILSEERESIIIDITSIAYQIKIPLRKTNEHKH